MTSQPKLILYHFPNACSQVCLCAIEETGLEYQLELIDLAANQQAAPAYELISPLGKVPALSTDGNIIFENAAILTYFAYLKPEAGLFPEATRPIDFAMRQAGLSFCGGTLHPIARGIAAPHRLTDGEVEPVRARAISLAVKNFGFAERRLAELGWWLGEWSIIDVYLNWAVQIVRSGGFNLEPYPLLAGLEDRLMTRTSFARVMESEAESLATLSAQRA